MVTTKTKSKASEVKERAEISPKEIKKQQKETEKSQRLKALDMALSQIEKQFI